MKPALTPLGRAPTLTLPLTLPHTNTPVVTPEEGEGLVELRHQRHVEHRVAYGEVAALNPCNADEQAGGYADEHDEALDPVGTWLVGWLVGKCDLVIHQP